MKFISQLIITALTTAATVVGLIVAGIEWNDNRMDKKDAEVKKEMVRMVENKDLLWKERLIGMEGRIKEKISASDDKIESLTDDVKALYQIGRRIDRKVTIVKEPSGLYTRTKSDNSNVGGSL